MWQELAQVYVIGMGTRRRSLRTRRMDPEWLDLDFMSLSLPPLVSGAAPTSAVYTTSSHRSSQSLSRRTQEALEDFHYHCHPYGPNAGLCLVSRCRARNYLTIAHFVQRCSKPEQLSLYEYCLGCDWNTFDVNSIHNLAYLKVDCHHCFDIGTWLLLPDLSTLQEVKSFVQAILTARENGSKTENFLTKWNLGLMTTYSFFPLTSTHEPIPRREQLTELWEVYYPPFCLFPALKSHVSPPLAVINGGPRLAGLDLEAVALAYHGQNSDETDLAATRERLTLLRHIWGLITDAQDAAKKWENESRRKKRKHHN